LSPAPVGITSVDGAIEWNGLRLNPITRLASTISGRHSATGSATITLLEQATREIMPNADIPATMPIESCQRRHQPDRYRRSTTSDEHIGIYVTNGGDSFNRLWQYYSWWAPAAASTPAYMPTMRRLPPSGLITLNGRAAAAAHGQTLGILHCILQWRQGLHHRQFSFHDGGSQRWRQPGIRNQRSG